MPWWPVVPAVTECSVRAYLPADAAALSVRKAYRFPRWLIQAVLHRPAAVSRGPRSAVHRPPGIRRFAVVVSEAVFQGSVCPERGPLSRRSDRSPAPGCPQASAPIPQLVAGGRQSRLAVFLTVAVVLPAGSGVYHFPAGPSEAVVSVHYIRFAIGSVRCEPAAGRP